MPLTRYATETHVNARLTRAASRSRCAAAAKITERSEPFAIVCRMLRGATQRKSGRAIPWGRPGRQLAVARGDQATSSSPHRARGPLMDEMARTTVTDA